MGVGTSWHWRILFVTIFCWNLCSTTTDYDLLDSEELLGPTTTSEPLPYFDDHTNLTNITAPLGSTAFLHCRVNLLKDKTIDETEWVEGVSILCRGTPEELIHFCYTTYDINGDKSLAREELHHSLKGSLYALGGILNPDEIDEGLREIVETLMRKLDVDKVSWMKREGSEVHLLTFGLHTYSGDERLSINFEQPNNWKLRIQSAERTDEGHYFCQISSHPPVSHHMTLKILVPKISIVDDLGKPITDKFYNAGSTLELRCIISHFHFPDGYSILWKQGNKTLNYDASRGGISVKTTVNKKEGATSVLYIANARRNDSGPYICGLCLLGTPTMQLAHNMIYVHVINGDVPAAMQHSGAATQVVRQSVSNFFIVVVFFLSSILRNDLDLPKR